MYETIETHARAFLPLNISAVGSVGPLFLNVLVRGKNMNCDFCNEFVSKNKTKI